MHLRLALRPDLAECSLEDRTLPAVPIGLLNPQFIPSPAGSNAFVVPGFQLGVGGGGSSGPSAFPGPNWSYLMVGVNTGLSVGTPTSFLGSINLPNLTGVAVGSGANVSGGSGGASLAAGGAGTFNGPVAFGGTFSSGYNTSLNSANGFGMTATPVGSVTAHIYDTGSTVSSSTGGSESSGTSGMSTTSTTESSPSSGASSGTGVSTTGTSGTSSTSGNSLLGPVNRLTGRPLGQGNSLLIGPGLNRRP